MKIWLLHLYKPQGGQCNFMKCLGGVSFRKISGRLVYFIYSKKMTENRAWIHSKETAKKILC